MLRLILNWLARPGMVGGMLGCWGGNARAWVLIRVVKRFDQICRHENVRRPVDCEQVLIRKACMIPQERRGVSLATGLNRPQVEHRSLLGLGKWRQGHDVDF